MKKLLFIGSAFQQHNQELPQHNLDLPQIVREIQDSVQQRKGQESLELEQEWAVRRAEVINILNKHNPDILQFSCHTKDGELLLQDQEEGGGVVPIPAVGELFAIIKSLKLVLFCSNGTDKVAKTALQKSHLLATIGISGEINPEEVRMFLKGFYSTLCYGRSLETAFQSGKLMVWVALHKKVAADKFRLYVRRDLDSKQIFLVTEEKRVITHPMVKSLVRVSACKNYVSRGTAWERIQNQITEHLNEAGYCFVKGMSGEGKSELVRTYAQNHVKEKVVEYYLGDTCQGSLEEQYQKLVSETDYTELCIWNMEQETLNAVKHQLYLDFLKERPLIILLRYHSENQELLERLKNKGARVLVTTEELLKTEERAIDLEQENSGDPDFLFRVFEQNFSRKQNILKYKEGLCSLFRDKLKGNLTLIRMLAEQMRDIPEYQMDETLQDLLEEELDIVLDESGDYREEKEYGTLKRLFASSIRSGLTPNEMCVLQVMMCMRDIWVDKTTIETLLGDYGRKNRCVRESIQTLLQKRLLLVTEKRVRRKGAWAYQEQVSMSALAAVVIRNSQKGEILYLPKKSPAFIQHLQKNGVYLTKYPLPLKQEIEAMEEQGREAVKARLEEAFQTGIYRAGETYFPYEALFHISAGVNNSSDLEKLKKYFQHSCYFSLVEHKKMMKICVTPFHPKLKEFTLGVWNREKRYFEPEETNQNVTGSRGWTCRLLSWIYVSGEKQVDWKQWKLPDQVDGVDVTQISSEFSVKTRRKNEIDTLILPSKLEDTGAKSFFRLPLKKVEFGEGLRVIGKEAFLGCRYLECIEPLPQSLEIIGARAFAYCDNLKETKIPQGVSCEKDIFKRKR